MCWGAAGGRENKEGKIEMQKKRGWQRGGEGERGRTDTLGKKLGGDDLAKPLLLPILSNKVQFPPITSLCMLFRWLTALLP